jgi:hypothetical protein
MRNTRTPYKIWSVNLKVGGHLEDAGVDGRIPKFILEKYGVNTRTGYKRLRTASSRRSSKPRQRNIEFYKRRETASSAE